jgi:hypothetical protein
MSVSILEKLAATFTDASMPKLYRDPSINPGTKYCFDFTNPFCNPNADGAIPTGSTFNNLVDGAASATATVAAAGTRFTNAAGKAGLVSGNTGGGNINLGPAGVYDRAVLNHEFLFIIWMKLAGSGFATNYPNIMFQGGGGNRNNEQFWMDMGPDGLSPYLTIGNSSSSNMAAGATATAGAVFQFAVNWVPGVSLTSFKNGAQVASNTSSVYSTLLSAAAQSLQISGSTSSTLYRVQEEDMVVNKQIYPTMTAAQIVAADYATFNGKFV